VQSIEESSVNELTATIKKHSPNVVIWSAGAGGGSPERTKAVDHEGKSDFADLLRSSSSHADFEKKVLSRSLTLPRLQESRGSSLSVQ
jgi:hypothetical protein